MVPALINFNLLNDSLIHSIKVAHSKALICGWEVQEGTKDVLELLDFFLSDQNFRIGSNVRIITFELY